MNDLISIIVPVYKAELWIERCILSIIGQTYNKLEIILVDDGSPDQSGKICDEYAKRDERIRVIHIENGGAAKARNIGLNYATGKYIGFVDSDDYIEPEMYELLFQTLKDNEVDISCVGIIREDENKKNQYVIRCPKEVTVYSDREIIREILRSRYVGSSLCTKLYSRECWENLRLAEGETNEDTKVTFELYTGRKMIHTAQALYHYTVNSTSVTHSLSYKNLETTFNNAYEFVEKTENLFPEIKNDALYYITDIAKLILMQESIDRNTKLYRDCRNTFENNYKLLGFDWRVILLRLNLYHRFKNLLRGKKSE